jgi:2'-5' RNA ligase
VRLFVAVEVPADVRDSLARDVYELRPTAPVGLRWSDPSRWHLTLAFLGEVQDAQLEELSRRVARAAARYTGPVLRLTGAGQFGGRVLWARVVEDAEKAVLPFLAASVSAAARRSGVAQDERPYRPHITLARASSTVDLRPMVAALEGARSRVWTVDDVLLVRSRLGPRPVHTTIRRFPMHP